MKIDVYSVSADYVTFNIFKCLGFRQEAGNKQTRPINLQTSWADYIVPRSM